MYSVYEELGKLKVAKFAGLISEEDFLEKVAAKFNGRKLVQDAIGRYPKKGPKIPKVRTTPATSAADLNSPSVPDIPTPDSAETARLNAHAAHMKNVKRTALEPVSDATQTKVQTVGSPMPENQTPPMPQPPQQRLRPWQLMGGFGAGVAASNYLNTPNSGYGYGYPSINYSWS